MDILLRQVSTGNLLYSPNRRSFITKTATTNFKADEFTDPVGKQLQHLGSDMYRMARYVVLMGCYGCYGFYSAANYTID